MRRNALSTALDEYAKEYFYHLCKRVFEEPLREFHPPDIDEMLPGYVEDKLPVEAADPDAIELLGTYYDLKRSNPNVKKHRLTDEIQDGIRQILLDHDCSFYLIANEKGPFCTLPEPAFERDLSEEYKDLKVYCPSKRRID